MNRDGVRKRMGQVIALMREEQTLRLELCTLDLGLGGKEQLDKNLTRHDDILREINKLRLDRMMPIFRELGGFIAECESVRPAAAS